MDLWTIVKVVVRRWYVSFPVMLAAALAAYSITSKVPSSYQVTGSVILSVPNSAVDTPDGRRNNPYLAFSGSLSITAHALVRVLDSPEERRRFAGEGLRRDYVIQTEANFPGIRVAVLGKDGATAIRTAQRLIELIGQRLTTLEDQSGAPPDQRIGIRVLDPPTSATELPPSVARVAAMIGGLGLAAATGLALVLEALARSRKRATAVRRTAAPTPEAVTSAPLDAPLESLTPRPSAPDLLSRATQAKMEEMTTQRRWFGRPPGAGRPSSGTVVPAEDVGGGG